MPTSGTSLAGASGVSAWVCGLSGASCFVRMSLSCFAMASSRSMPSSSLRAAWPTRRRLPRATPKSSHSAAAMASSPLGTGRLRPLASSAARMSLVWPFMASQKRYSFTWRPARCSRRLLGSGLSAVVPSRNSSMPRWARQSPGPGGASPSVCASPKPARAPASTAAASRAVAKMQRASSSLSHSTFEKAGRLLLLRTSARCVRVSRCTPAMCTVSGRRSALAPSGPSGFTSTRRAGGGRAPPASSSSIRSP
mmetsp:Transcript_17743/g.54878  ORF Transcript_17743/g.54878 Transcript_17743/m.54878 type:complete len:252 (-) Transcript_17743:234-989(-)